MGFSGIDYALSEYSGENGFRSNAFVDIVLITDENCADISGYLGCYPRSAQLNSDVVLNELMQTANQVSDHVVLDAVLDGALYAYDRGQQRG